VSVKLYGVLVTYRRSRELEVMLARLASQERPLDLLVLVDNSPTPEQEAAALGYGERGHAVRYLPAPENLGPAGGIALGMRAVLELAGDDDWIVALDDDDPPVTPATLGDLLGLGERMVASDPTTAAVGLGGATFDRRRAVLVPIPDDQPGPVAVDCIGGNRWPLYRVRAVRAVGPFATPLFFGFDDLEYGLRLRDAGYTMYARRPPEGERPPGYDLPRGGRPTASLPQPTWRRYYGLRNLIWILRASGNGRAALRLIVLSGLAKPLAHLAVRPRAALAVLRLNARACRDGWSGVLGRTVEPS
jgi:glycosyltransferase involved in cell wall biosynthesis